MARPDRTGGGSRLVGVDVARGLAILGMLWSHFAPDGSGSALPDGRSAILFATLAGVSLGLLTGGARPPAGWARLAGYRTVAVRGIVLLVLGRLLVLLGTPIAVILDYYGALFLLLLVVLFAPRVVVAVVGVLAWTVGALLIQQAGPDLTAAFDARDPAQWPSEWLVTGFYPVALYAGYAAAGLVAARSDLSRRRTQVAMVVVGGVLTPLGYLVGGAVGVDAGPHADTTWEAVGSGGLAIALIGLLQLVSGARVVRTLLSPVADMGSMPLTIYTGQVIATALFLAEVGDVQHRIGFWWLLAGMVGGSLLFAVVWRRLVGRGPLETILALISRARAPGGGPPPPSAAGVPRALGRGLLAAGVGVALVLVASLLVAPTPPRAEASDPVATIAAPRGTLDLRLDGEALRSAGVRVGATGTGTAVGGAARLPVTGGEVQASVEAVAGGVALEGSGIVLDRRGHRVTVSDLVVDLDAGTVAGTLRTGTTRVEGVLLFEFPSPQTKGGASGHTSVDLDLSLPRSVVALLDAGLGSPGFEAGAAVGTAHLAISGS